MLLTTPFHSRTAPLCEAQNWRRWAGYMVASSYDLTHDREYYAIRNSAALIDVSPLYKYLISGPDTARLLDRMVTRDVTRCAVGQVMYTPWCDEAGKVIDDGTIQRLDEDTYRLTAADPTLRWLYECAGGLDVEIEDQSDGIAALAIQGPLARAVLTRASDIDLDGLRYFRLAHGKVARVKAVVTRTGYTGDLGYEIWIEAGHAERVWDALMDAGRDYGIAPAGMLALDMARIEAGLLLADVDYISTWKARIEDQKSSPLELGLGRAVDWRKERFVGRRALAAERDRDPAWKFVGLVVDWESLERAYAEVSLPPQLPGAAWRTSVPVYREGRQVGYASSGCWSPVLKRYIALAHLRAPHFREGTRLTMEITVEHQRRLAEVRVAPTPFFDPPRKKG